MTTRATSSARVVDLAQGAQRVVFTAGAMQREPIEREIVLLRAQDGAAEHASAAEVTRRHGTSPLLGPWERVEG